MGPEGVRAAIDAGDVEGLRALLREDRGLTTALVAAREIQPTSPGTPLDAESDGHPAIHWAREQGRPNAVAYLEAKG